MTAITKMTVISPIICEPHHLDPQNKEALMKKSFPIDSDEPHIRDLLSRDYCARRCSDQELHRILQDLIDSDHRLLIEIKLVAWHDAFNLRARRKT